MWNKVLFFTLEYVSKEVRVVPSINRPTRVRHGWTALSLFLSWVQTGRVSAWIAIGKKLQMNVRDQLLIGRGRGRRRRRRMVIIIIILIF